MAEIAEAAPAIEQGHAEGRHADRQASTDGADTATTGEAASRPGSPNGRTPSRVGVESGGDTQDYLHTLRIWLERHKHYPRAARMRRQEGTVVVRLVIEPDGRVRTQQIERGSGHAILDREVTAMIARAAPFPPVPPEVGRQGIEIVTPVEFSLR